MVMAVSGFIFGFSERNATMANMVFMLVLLLSQYYAGKKLGGTAAGLLACALLPLYPYITALSRSSLPDFAMTAMVSLAVCLLIYSEEFQRFLPSFLFGAVCGLGMLTKQMFAFFVIGPALFTLALALGTKGPGKKIPFFNIALSFAAASGITCWWYLPKLQWLLPLYLKNANNGYVDDGAQLCPPVLSTESILYNLNNLVNNQLLYIFFFVFLAGLALWLASKGKWRYKLMMLVSIMVPYVIFIFIMTKQQKTIAPYLVFFSLITAAGLTTIKNKVARTLLASIVLFIGFLQYYDVNYQEGFFFKPLKHYPFGKALLRQRHYSMPPFRHSFIPLSGSGVSGEIFNAINSESGGRPRLCLGAYFGDTLNSEEGINVIVADGKSLEYTIKSKRLLYSMEDLKNPEHRHLPDFLVVTKKATSIFDKRTSARFLLVRTFVFNDKSELYLYKLRTGEKSG
jgi:hypothetical protein